MSQGVKYLGAQIMAILCAEIVLAGITPFVTDDWDILVSTGQILGIILLANRMYYWAGGLSLRGANLGIRVAARELSKKD